MTAHDELVKRIRRTQADCPDSLEAADAIEQLQRDNAALMTDGAEQARLVKEACERAVELEAKLVAMEAQLEIPDYAMPPDGQEWALIGSAVAFHLIGRHAENWAHAGQLMEAWRDATVFVADHAVAKDAARYRWLKSKREDFDRMGGASYYATKLWNALGCRLDWDAAIDAALAQKEG